MLKVHGIRFSIRSSSWEVFPTSCAVIQTVCCRATILIITRVIFTTVKIFKTFRRCTIKFVNNITIFFTVALFRHWQYRLSNVIMRGLVDHGWFTAHHGTSSEPSCMSLDARTPQLSQFVYCKCATGFPADIRLFEYITVTVL